MELDEAISMVIEEAQTCCVRQKYDEFMAVSKLLIELKERRDQDRKNANLYGWQND